MSSTFVNALTRTLTKTGLQLKKHSPEILVVAGCVGAVVSAVMACKATTKVHTITDKTREEVDKVQYALENPEALTEEYTEEDSKKDLAIIYTKTAVEFVKLYAPAVILGTLSLTSILASNNIMRKRNVAIAAAYTAVDKSFKEYRGRVIDRFGKELDRELRFNLKAKEVEENVVDENGEVHTEKKTIKVATTTGSEAYSEYARFYDCGCRGWEKDPEMSLMFLRRVQDFMNERLKAKRFVFLNEVYEELGIPKTKAGNIVGWVYNKDNPTGDNYIDFGVYSAYHENARDFVNGYEPVIILDFNVDGNILDLIDNI